LTDDPKAADQLARKYAQLRKLPPEEVRQAFLAGNVEEVKQQIQAHIDKGVTHIILNMYHPFDREGMQRFAKEVIPAFR
jgi:alkanesulfonate monooxygenase SsuD/methylene tetrahydromethanopterin reductase-like flavin-dependent oxidoreductase (luciferase family)